jgi:hypothetical protein
MTVARYRRLAIAALVLLCCASGASRAASLDALAADGLYTWRVAATEDAPAWCCACWTRDASDALACDLDSRHVSYGEGDEFLPASEEIQIYARIESGKAWRIRALSPRCAVTTRSEVVDLGVVEVDESLAWLQSNATATAAARRDALVAIAAHRGPAALRFLAKTAEDGSTMDLREDAIFAISRLPGERAVDALLGVLANPQMHREVREQALFWLAHSDSDRAFEYLDRLLAGGR